MLTSFRLIASFAENIKITTTRAVKSCIIVLKIREVKI